MDIPSQKKIFNDLFMNVNGYALSAKARLKLPYFYNAHIYGEIDFDNFYSILSTVYPKKDEIFYDLGSGTGKAVVLAALCFPFSKCIGIEKLDELYKSSKIVEKKLNNPSVQFIFDDFKTYNFSDGDVIYLNSYYFDYEMLERTFLESISSLKTGTRVIFVHTPLKHPLLEQISVKMFTFSWGTARVYTFVKI